MPVIRLTKHFEFEMAHFLSDYDGPCRNIHGHTYKLQVTILGRPINETGHPKNGMVMDFKDLKKIIKEEIITDFDHALVVPEGKQEDLIRTLEDNGHKLVYFPGEPTCELLVYDFAQRIKNELPENAQLYSLVLYETSTSFASYFESDNAQVV